MFQYLTVTRSGDLVAILTSGSWVEVCRCVGFTPNLLLCRLPQPKLACHRRVPLTLTEWFTDVADILERCQHQHNAVNPESTITLILMYALIHQSLKHIRY